MCLQRAASSTCLMAVLSIALPYASGAAAADESLVVDCSHVIGTLRPLHGVNNGPIDQGNTVDLRDAYRRMNPPFVRLHDVHWPNADCVDVHTIFPTATADPHDPRSFAFGPTDEYLKPLIDLNTRVIYRLGESIEYWNTKRHVSPPADPARWAEVCVAIARHYTASWAQGAQSDKFEWEIWNEPDNRPNCWTGSDDDYFKLYELAATAMKKEFPHAQVGGPAVGNIGRVGGGGCDPPPSSIASSTTARHVTSPSTSSPGTCTRVIRRA